MTEQELLQKAVEYDRTLWALRYGLLGYVGSLSPSMSVYRNLYFPLLDAIRESRPNARNSATAVGDGIKRFCWKVGVGELKVDWKDVCTFAVTLEDIGGLCTEGVLRLLPNQVSSDGAYDFVESIPLAGPKVVDKIQKGKYANIQGLYADIKAWLGTDVDLVCDEPGDGCICGNETLMYTSFIDALIEYYRLKERTDD